MCFRTRVARSCVSHSTAGSSGRSLEMRRAISHFTAENFVKTTLEQRDHLNHRMKSRYIYLPYKTTESYFRVLQVWIHEGWKRKSSSNTLSSYHQGRLCDCFTSSNIYFVTSFSWFIPIKFKTPLKTHFSERLPNHNLLVNYTGKVPSKLLLSFIQE